jgi:hypothetical protein
MPRSYRVNARRLDDGQHHRTDHLGPGFFEYVACGGQRGAGGEHIIDQQDALTRDAGLNLELSAQGLEPCSSGSAGLHGCALGLVEHAQAHWTATEPPQLLGHLGRQVKAA